MCRFPTYLTTMASSTSTPTAIITGASTGIGRGIAIGMAKEGKYKLCLISRNMVKMEETERLCLEQNKNVDIRLTQCDLSDAKELKMVFHKVCTEYGPIHVLVNNAGMMGAGPIPSADMDYLNTMFNVNLKAVVFGTQICLPFIIESAKQKKASCAVISISSILGTDYGVGMRSTAVSAYSASKHGVRIFNECLFEEVKEHGIKCCCIMPGYVKTPMTESVVAKYPNLGLKLEDFLNVEDVSQSVQYVLSVSDKACPTNIVIRSQHAML